MSTRLSKGDRARLDSLPIDDVASEMPTEPRRVKTYAEGRGCSARCRPDHHDHWRQGDGRPPLADDDPAVMCAIGRCASARVWVKGIPRGSFHPDECGWCIFPLPQLLVALDWSTWFSRHLLTETWHWTDPEYHREVRSNVYEQPGWAAFTADTSDAGRRQRSYLVDQVVAASR